MLNIRHPHFNQQMRLQIDNRQANPVPFALSSRASNSVMATDPHLAINSILHKRFPAFVRLPGFNPELFIVDFVGTTAYQVFELNLQQRREPSGPSGGSVPVHFVFCHAPVIHGANPGELHKVGPGGKFVLMPISTRKSRNSCPVKKFLFSIYREPCRLNETSEGHEGIPPGVPESIDRSIEVIRHPRRERPVNGVLRRTLIFIRGCSIS